MLKWSQVNVRLPHPWLTVSIALALVLGVMMIGCSREIGDNELLFPHRHPVQEERPGRDNIVVPLDDGVELRGWHFHEEAREHTLLHWYGNGETVLTAMYRLEWLARELDVNVIAVDYRGYGFSDGTASVHAVLSDALAVYDFARDELGVREPLVYGRSLGTAPAILVADERPVSGLILEAPFTSLEDVLKAWQRSLPVPFRWVMRLKPAPGLKSLGRQPVDRIGDYTGPLLILHGENDTTIPAALGRRVFEAATGSNKTWCAVPGVAHNDLQIGNDPVAGALKAFVAGGAETRGQ